ncbi:MAG: hypothetical protein VR64_23815 [Desulfatitalea sp. BRH_c12]|nr:MAG: hypothetical protein VR64_23815 [Desulfatitalea sp. BRH_c12]
MNNRSADTTSISQIGIVVIGRNEGENLRRSLNSMPIDDRVVALYVDSGSTDGSIELARAKEIDVHALDPSRPFSAGRARSEGVDKLLAAHPQLAFIQFVDGDCELELGWIEAGIVYLETHPDVAIVCGRLSEREPDRSIYNWLSSLQWHTPAGEIANCGGIFMVRKDAYLSAGGFSRILLTREEKELCDRIRMAGHRIVRVDKQMARHSADLLTFVHWWQRAVWGGYGDALQINTRKEKLSREHWHRVRRYLTWPIGVPFLALAGLIGVTWTSWAALVPLACLTAYGLLFAKIAMGRLRIGNTPRDAMLYAFFIILRKFGAASGFIRYFLQKRRDLKRPDPHAA